MFIKKTPYRISKDQNGAYGTANNYSWSIASYGEPYENKKIIKLNLSKFIQFLPSFFKESLKKSPNFLQQLLIIDNSKYTEKKTIL